MVNLYVNLLENSELYSIGENTYGELGVDGVLITDNQLVHLKSFEQPVTKIAVGARHSLILLKNGDLYAFGDNSDSQCTGYTDRYPTPIKITFNNIDTIIDIYSGYNHCLIVLGMSNI
jgi:alpha-tubulin suppressor-like RCC1 family protein